VDAVLASVAMAGATGTISASTSFEEDCSYPEALSGEFQVAAYQALLASLLSPCCHRPPFLAQGLSIFRHGKCLLGSPKFMLFAFPPPVLLLCAESSLCQNQLGCAS
jgi:proline/glutamate/leucine-rich protein 1